MLKKAKTKRKTNFSDAENKNKKQIFPMLKKNKTKTKQNNARIFIFLNELVGTKSCRNG